MKLTLKETAELLGYNPSYFTNRRKQVEDFGPPAIEGKGKTLFDFDEVVRWAEGKPRRLNTEVLHRLNRQNLEAQGFEFSDLPDRSDTVAENLAEEISIHFNTDSHLDGETILEKIEELREEFEIKLNALRELALKNKS